MALTIPIFLSSDNNYAPFVATTIASICDNTKSFCEFYILDGGITEENKEKICELKKRFSNFSIEFVNINREIFAKFLTNSYITVVTYYRLIIPKLYPNINNFLYLDVDIIANGDIVELYNIDLENFTIGAIEDVGNAYYIKRLKYNIEISQKHIYFNAGVLLIDNLKWNEQNISDKLFEIEEKYRGRLECNDQDILNKYFENNYKQLPQKYNSKKIENNTIIRHFYQHIKPWNIHPNATLGSKLLPDFETFWNYAKMTPFHDELLKNCKYDTNHKVHIHLIYKKLNEQKKVTTVSIIIPVYNTEKYLKKCLDTVSNQSLLNLEIICINDASTDNSLEILEEYSQYDDRIKIINFEENKGVAVARNEGIKIATGKYITFVDSDDWVDSDYIEKMFSVAKETDADIVVNKNIVRNETHKSFIYNHPGESNLKLNSFINPHKEIDKIFPIVCSKLYKTKFIKDNKLKFPAGFVNEDFYFQYISFAYADKVYYTSLAPYHYRYNDNSIINTQVDFDLNHIKIFGLIYDFYKEHNLLEKKIKIYSTMPSFNIKDEKAYAIYKSYFEKTINYINNNAEIFNELDMYFANNVVNSTSYEDYISKFPKSAVMSFLRRKK